MRSGESQGSCLNVLTPNTAAERDHARRLARSPTEVNHHGVRKSQAMRQSFTAQPSQQMAINKRRPKSTVRRALREHPLNDPSALNESAEKLVEDSLDLVHEQNKIMLNN